MSSMPEHSSEGHARTVTPNEETAKEPSQSPPNTKLEQAVKFWTNPSVADVPVAEKLNYLRKKQGMEEEDILQLWERLVEEQEKSTTRENGLSTQPTTPTPKRTTKPSGPPDPHKINTTTSYQYNQSGYPGTQYAPLHYQQQEQESVDEGAYIPAFLTIGGFIGLAAAAGFRWLNGGDFMLFPPPTRHGNATSKATDMRSTGLMEQQVGEEESVMNEEDDENDSEEYYGTEEEGSDEPEPSRLEKHLERLIEAIRTSNEAQEGLVKRLVGQSTKEVTDVSMNRLRQRPADRCWTRPDTVGLWLIFGKLVEIKHQLEFIQQNREEDESLSSVLRELSSCLSEFQVQNSEPSPTPHKTTQPQARSNNKDIEAAPTLSTVTVDPLSPIEQAEKSPPETLRDVMETLARNNTDKASLKVGAQLLHLYVVNLCSNPHVSRYRKIFTNNESFRKVENLDGGKELLMMVGFEQVGKSLLEWKPLDEEKSLERLKVVAAALSVLKSASPSTTTDELVYIQKVVAPLLPLIEEEEAGSPRAAEGLHPLSTPETNSLLSPPEPKRDPTLPTPLSFPGTPVHTTPVAEEQSAVRLFPSPTEVIGSGECG